MTDIHPGTAEIRQGKKEIGRKKKPQDENMPALFHRAANMNE